MAGRIVDGQASKEVLSSKFWEGSVRLPRRIAVVTPENVGIEYELAGIASRCAAAVVDLLIQAVAILIAIGIYFALQYFLHFSIVGWPTSVLIVLGFLLWWGYYVYFETQWTGQTPGKRWLRLRVVKTGGTPIDLPSAAIRGLIRAIDIEVIGVLAILVTPRNQRLGDLAAGTLVVKERSEWQGDIAKPQAAATSGLPEAELVRNIELVTPEQFETAKRFTTRASELDPSVREQIAARIAQPLMQHLGIEDNGRIVYSNLLSAIHDRCVEDRGMR
jgi:uncharacterized RDD family membrane protein YckC